MKLHGLLLALLLVGCAPQATIADPDPEALRFVELPSYDLAVVANAPIEYGTVEVAGLELVIESKFCAVEDCAPAQDGYIRLTYPDEPDANYGRRLEVTVLDGVPIKGRAEFTLRGEDLSRPAILKTEGRR